MSAIQDISEPWAEHTFKEVEDFIKNELNEIEEDIEDLRELIEDWYE